MAYWEWWCMAGAGGSLKLIDERGPKAFLIHNEN